MQYYYKYIKGKKLSENRTRMHQVTVYDLNGNMIGSHAWMYVSKHKEEEAISERVTMIIREHELRQIWSKLP